MSARADLRIRGLLVIPAGELVETASRSRGPGGQHVNKTSTRVTLRWNAAESAVLTPAQRRRLLSRLARRLTRRQHLVVHADRFRSRTRNRELARSRLAELIEAALRTDPRRVPTAPSRAARARGREQKARLAAKKQRRRRVRGEDDA